MSYQLPTTSYIATRATPAATRSAASQRLLSTRSCRNNFATIALAMNVSEADAGATKLTSAHESANSSEKNAHAMKATPSHSV